jgi:hypothetical protein
VGTRCSKEQFSDFDDRDALSSPCACCACCYSVYWLNVGATHLPAQLSLLSSAYWNQQTVQMREQIEAM